MPDSNNPHLSTWIKQLENSIPDLDENTILVGHSLGCVTVLRYLLKKGIRICGIVLVSGFIGQNPMSIQTEGLSGFVQGELDFIKINHLAPKRYVITASDDDIVPSCSTQEMAKTLDAQLIVLDSGKHFIERDGYMSFPVLLNILQQMVEL
ncbi:conserved hypothetical protein [uncultured Eubacteriales bacterium]|uniref:Esterase n=1 Tax=uncultured Eubacteriales bacterium TaxID=172733 RepID=A0A212JTS0_9FIRM|nr:conserved hypothetical protein [uncultured Eubacteriales bacterium]